MCKKKEKKDEKCKEELQCSKESMPKVVIGDYVYIYLSVIRKEGREN